MPYQFRETKNPLLKGIYKAGECKDESDFMIALEQLNEVKKSLTNVRGRSRAVYSRERSLISGYRKYMKKNVHS